MLLVDADFGLANVDVQLGLGPDFGRGGDLGAVVSGRVALEAAAARHPAGFSLLAGCSGSGALSGLPAARLAGLLDGLRRAARAYDHVLLDLGAGLDPGLRRMAVFADRLLLVLTDEPTSLTDAYAVLKTYVADQRDARSPSPAPLESASVVVNQAASATEARRTYDALARACVTFLGGAPTLAGVVRRDPQVRAAIRRQTPLLDHAPAAPAAADVGALAALL